MNIKKKFFHRDSKPFPGKIKAIVIHWDDGFLSPIEKVWERINKSKKSFHYLISKNEVIQTLPIDSMSSHCTHNTYRKKAKDFFKTKFKKDSPDDYTLSCLMVHDNYNGSYQSETVNSSIETLSDLCHELELKPETDLWRHSDITNENERKCPRAFFEDDEDPDDLWNSFIGWVVEYKKAVYNN